MSTATSKAQQTRDDQAAALDHLRRVFTPESVINTNTVYATDSARRVQVYVVQDGGRIWDCSIVVARALGRRFIDPKGGAPSGIVVGGSGFDAGHDVAYALRVALFGGTSRDVAHNRV